MGLLSALTLCVAFFRCSPTSHFTSRQYEAKSWTVWKRSMMVDDLIKLHGKGKALTILAHKLARAIYYMLKKNVPFNLEKFLATA